MTMMFSLSRFFLLVLVVVDGSTVTSTSTAQKHRPPLQRRSVLSNDEKIELPLDDDEQLLPDNSKWLVKVEDDEQGHSEHRGLTATALHSDYVVNVNSDTTTIRTAQVQRASTKTHVIISSGGSDADEDSTDDLTKEMDSLYEGEDESSESRSRENSQDSGDGVRKVQARAARQYNYGCVNTPVSCRCEYPGEGVYGTQSSANNNFDATRDQPAAASPLSLDAFGVFARPNNNNNDSSRNNIRNSFFNRKLKLKSKKKDDVKFATSRELRGNGFNASNLRTVNGQRILPSTCWACQNVQYRCPGEPMNDCPMWNMQCFVKTYPDGGGGRGNGYGGKGGKGGGGKKGNYRYGRGKGGGKGGKKGRRQLDEEYEEDAYVNQKHSPQQSEEDDSDYSGEDDEEEYGAFSSADDSATPQRRNRYLAPRALRSPSQRSLIATADKLKGFFNRQNNDGDVGPTFSLPSNLKDILNNRGDAAPIQQAPQAPSDSANTNRFSDFRAPFRQDTVTTPNTLSSNLGSILDGMKAPNRRDESRDDNIRGAGGGGYGYDGGGGGGGCTSCGNQACRIVVLPANHPNCNSGLDCKPTPPGVPAPPGCPPSGGPPPGPQPTPLAPFDMPPFMIRPSDRQPTQPIPLTPSGPALPPSLFPPPSTPTGVPDPTGPRPSLLPPSLFPPPGPLPPPPAPNSLPSGNTFPPFFPSLLSPTASPSESPEPSPSPSSVPSVFPVEVPPGPPRPQPVSPLQFVSTVQGCWFGDCHRSILFILLTVI